MIKSEEPDLDPEDWAGLRALGHRMLDDMIDHLQGLRDQPVWQPMPAEIRERFQTPLPREAGEAEAAYAAFTQLVKPYATGNTHPRFMGWVHGGGTVIGMLAEMLAAGLNANLGGRDHAPIEVERQIIRWAAEMLGMPAVTSGLLVTGSSMANLIGVLVARSAALGPSLRQDGLAGRNLTAYAGANAHGCIPRALDLAGLGSSALRPIACTDGTGPMRLDALAEAVARDRQAGALPFFVAATAGSVDTGAVDDLQALGAFCRAEGLWFHVDAAFGAFARLAPTLAPLLEGIEAADSVAFDFHKWGQVPYDAGCILVRDPAAQQAAFAAKAAYLRREPRGLAAGQPWPCDLGPDLSRGFRALKVWLSLQVHGADRLGQVVAHCCDLAQALAEAIRAEAALELLAPVTLNIVCFRYRGDPTEIDQVNVDIVADIQESGLAAPSTTAINGKLAIRAAIVNHRTKRADIPIVIAAVLRFGRARSNPRALPSMTA